MGSGSWELGQHAAGQLPSPASRLVAMCRHRACEQHAGSTRHCIHHAGYLTHPVSRTQPCGGTPPAAACRTAPRPAPGRCGCGSRPPTTGRAGKRCPHATACRLREGGRGVEVGVGRAGSWGACRARTHTHTLKTPSAGPGTVRLGPARRSLTHAVQPRFGVKHAGLAGQPHRHQGISEQVGPRARNDLNERGHMADARRGARASGSSNKRGGSNHSRGMPVLPGRACQERPTACAARQQRDTGADKKTKHPR